MYEVKRYCYLNAAEILKLDQEHQLAYFNHLTKVSLYDTMLEYERTKTQYYKDHPEELIIDAEYTVISSD